VSGAGARLTLAPGSFGRGSTLGLRKLRAEDACFFMTCRVSRCALCRMRSRGTGRTMLIGRAIAITLLSLVWGSGVAGCSDKFSSCESTRTCESSGAGGSAAAVDRDAGNDATTGSAGGAGGLGGGGASCDDEQCTNPPPLQCADEWALRIYSQTGTCQEGVCRYSFIDQRCSNRCTNARCS
jgi:hypothetical protein